MKRRLSFVACLSAVLMSAAPLCAQVSLLPSQEAAPTTVAAVEQPAGSFLNPLQQQEWVVLDSTGSVHGIYSQLGPDGTPRVLPGVTVQLSRNGAPIQTVVTEPDGHFAFQGLRVGAYALIAKSPSSVAAFALHILPAGASSKLDSNFIVFGTASGGAAVEGVMRPHAVATVNASGYYPDLQTDPAGDSRRFNTGAQVRLRAGNLLAGRISRPNGAGADLSGNTVHILQNGRVVAETVTNSAGEYQVPNIAPGVYDIIIAGKDGVAASSFRAVGGDDVSLNAKPAKAATSLVSTVQESVPSQQVSAVLQDTPDSLNIELVSPGDFFSGAPVEEVLPPTDFGMAPVPGAGFVGPGGFAGGGGGGGFGGGGGGGGFGGIGALLGIGGLAAGIAALASEDNGFNTVISSP